jgi:uncharacterized membrane protein (UPF0127 family)
MGISKQTRVSTSVLIGATAALVVAAGVILVFSLMRPSTSLFLGDGVFDAEIAYTQEAREKGLGGVENMTARKAMILAFPSDGQWQIWMKDMKVSIDIVWLDSDKKVVYVVKNAPADGGEKALYTPKSNARYVIEVPAGTVDRQSIVTGRGAVFDIDVGAIQ